MSVYLDGKIWICYEWSEVCELCPGQERWSYRRGVPHIMKGRGVVFA